MDLFKGEDSYEIVEGNTLSGLQCSGTGSSLLPSSTLNLEGDNGSTYVSKLFMGEKKWDSIFHCLTFSLSEKVKYVLLKNKGRRCILGKAELNQRNESFMPSYQIKMIQRFRTQRLNATHNAKHQKSHHGAPNIFIFTEVFLWLFCFVLGYFAAE